MIRMLLIAGCVVLGQPPSGSDAEVADEVTKLIRGLNADALSQREAAEQRLIELGPRIIELLPETNDRLSPEVQLRIDRISQVLRQARIASLTEPRNVTLGESAMKLTEVFAAIEEQTGNAIIDYREEFGQPSDDATVEVDFDNTTFWQALDNVLDQAALTVYSYGGEPGLTIVTSSSTVSRRTLADYQGAFRFEPVDILAQRNFGEPDHSVLRLKLAVAWEPRLRPIVVSHAIANVTVTDGQGNPIAVANENVQSEFSVNEQMHFQEFEIPLQSPSREVDKIGRVSGSVNFLIAGPNESFRFDPLTDERNVEQRRAQATVIMERVRKNQETWEIRVAVQFDDAAGALESHRGWIFNNPAMLIDAEGEIILPATIETTRRTEREVGMAYLFDVPQGLDGMTFVYETPVSILTHRVDYELRDLKLP